MLINRKTNFLLFFFSLSLGVHLLGVYFSLWVRIFGELSLSKNTQRVEVVRYTNFKQKTKNKSMTDKELKEKKTHNIKIKNGNYKISKNQSKIPNKQFDIPKLENRILSRTTQKINSIESISPEIITEINFSRNNSNLIPPIPENGPDSCRVPYPEMAKNLEVEGRFLFLISIDQSGLVKEIIQKNKEIGFGLDIAAKNGILNCKFKPAKLNNNTVAINNYPYHYDFVLE